MDRKVSVVIVNWNGRELLAECLEALRRQAYREFSVILVDNGSEDGSAAFVSEHFPEVRIVALQENSGFAAANNVALGMVDTEFVALLNNDAVPDPLWLKSLVEALEQHPQAGFAPSKILLCRGRDRIDRAGDGYTKAGAALLRGRGSSAESHRVREWVFGACAAAALYRMQMLRDIGFFDEAFFILYEDVDLSFRAQLRGYRCLYVPEALVYHRSSSSIGHDSSSSVYYGHRNLEWVYIQNMPFRLLLRTIVPHLLYDTLPCRSLSAAAGEWIFCGQSGMSCAVCTGHWKNVDGFKAEKLRMTGTSGGCLNLRGWRSDWRGVSGDEHVESGGPAEQDSAPGA
jgi:GT2 family glycosyltransferase